ncbi:MAG: Bcr/CflA family drug resistance efflux transporter, partial [Muriicola sp.]|nr:Bcr/CflA family drug resistance efflux transporter [Muriicola sp.]
TLLNGTLVVRFGMLRLITLALLGYVLIPLIYVLIFQNGVNPPYWIVLIFFAMEFFAVGFIFGNLRALAMEPVGHIAGIGAAITGCIATVMAVPISAYIGSFVVDSVLPIFIGFLACGVIAYAILGYFFLSKRGFLQLKRNK